MSSVNHYSYGFLYISHSCFVGLVICMYKNVKNRRLYSLSPLITLFRRKKTSDDNSVNLYETRLKDKLTKGTVDESCN